MKGRISLFLSAYAEDYGLCPWMNADSVAKSFMYPWVNATADYATGGYAADLLAEQVLWQARALGLRTRRFHRWWAQAGIS
jgi:hypothetical protein